MVFYLIKSAACMAILLVFYKLLLERESIHVFKRLFLLVAIAASLGIPAITFTEYIIVEPIINSEIQPVLLSDVDYIGIPENLEADVIDIEPILWGLYFLGMTFFALRFMKNLFQIISRIRKNPKQKSKISIQVLLKENLPPHTFFKYIFLNKKRLELNEIPKEVILHEETHAHQKHSFDVVFIELLQVIFWFNPLIYLFKHAIKLNHEFLADRAVLNRDIDETTYQNTLLSYLSPDSKKKYQSSLANAINYSSIKKRFKIMKTQTSKKAGLIRSILVLPLLAILFFAFTQTELISVENVQSTTAIHDLNIEINDDGTYELNGENITLKEVSEVCTFLNKDLSTYQIRNYVFATILYKDNHIGLIEKVEAELRKTGVENIDHRSKKTALALQQDFFKPSKYNGKSLDEARAIMKEDYFQEMLTDEIDHKAVNLVSIEIKNKNEIWLEDQHIEFDTIAELINSNHKAKGDDYSLIIQIYSYGVLRSDFTSELTKELEKTGAKRIQVYSEEYIMRKDQFQDTVEIKPSTTRISANKLILEPFSSNIPVHINKKGQLLVDEKLVAIENLEKFISILSKDHSSEPNKVFRFTIYTVYDTPSAVIDQVYKILSPYGDVSIYPMEDDYNSSKIESIETKEQKGASLEQIKTYNKLAKSHNLWSDHGLRSRESEIRKVKHLYSLMTPDQRNTAEIFPNYPKKQEGATKEQLAEYNALAKKYNKMLSKNKSIQIKMKDVKRLKDIYRLMSEKQKSKAEAFPDFPTPPPAPEAPEAPEAPQMEKEIAILKKQLEEMAHNTKQIEKEALEMELKVEEIEREAKQVEREAAIVRQEAAEVELEAERFEKEAEAVRREAIKIEKLKAKLKENGDDYSAVKFYVPEPLTPPQSPLNHVIEMAKQGATFKYKRKTITSDEAIELVKNKKNLSISTKTINNNAPIVKISKSL